MGWVPEGQRSGQMSYTTASKSAAFVTIGEEDAATYEAISAGRNFGDIQARMTFRLLQKMMLKEEMAILGGNASLQLGTPATPTLSASGSGATLPAATQYAPPPCVKLRDTDCALRSVDDPSDGDDAVPDRVLDQFGCGPDPQHFHDARPVELRGPRGYLQEARDLLGRSALGRELQDFPLTRSQAMGGVRGSRAILAIGAAEIVAGVRHPFDGVGDFAHVNGSRFARHTRNICVRADIVKGIPKRFWLQKVTRNCANSFAGNELK